uniref:Retropepsins domain-containing protein n=1 Tax=Amphimedon queenslandica TaxID=400682 RepID=A0A1X7UXD7_AMPQE
MKELKQTGTDVTVIPERLYDYQRDEQLTPARVLLVGSSKSNLKLKDAFKAHMEGDRKRGEKTVYVVKRLQTPLVGRPAIQKLNFATRILGATRVEGYIITEFRELLNGQGFMKGGWSKTFFHEHTHERTTTLTSCGSAGATENKETGCDL